MQATRPAAVTAARSTTTQIMINRFIVSAPYEIDFNFSLIFVMKGGGSDA